MKFKKPGESPAFSLAALDIIETPILPLVDDRGDYMKMIFGTAALAALVLSGTTAFAQNTKRAPANLRTIQIDCMKQHGATFDKDRNAWMMPEVPQELGLHRLEAVYSCVAKRTGKPAQRFMREEVRYE